MSKPDKKKLKDALNLLNDALVATQDSKVRESLEQEEEDRLIAMSYKPSATKPPKKTGS